MFIPQDHVLKGILDLLHWQGAAGTMNPTPANNKNNGVIAQQ